MRLRFYFFALLLGLQPTSLQSQATWRLVFMPGVGVAVPSPLTIRQEGFSDLRFWTDWKTESLKFPIYYSYRLSRYENGRGWEAEMNHLKLYAHNLPSEVGALSITHGFNQLWVNRGWQKRHFILKTGGGIVIAHPENTVRGKQLDQRKGIGETGYYIAGPTADVGVQRLFDLEKHWFVSVEVKMSAAYVIVPIADGSANMPLLAFHLQVGPGFRLQAKR